MRMSIEVGTIHRRLLQSGPTRPAWRPATFPHSPSKTGVNALMDGEG